MKNITPVSIWDNGTVKQASVLDTYAINVQLNNSANFQYVLYSTVDSQINKILSQGNLIMSGESYAQWQSDSYAWDYVAEELNLTITGDYVPLVVNPIVAEDMTQIDTESEPIIPTNNNLE